MLISIATSILSLFTWTTECNTLSVHSYPNWCHWSRLTSFYGQRFLSHLQVCPFRIVKFFAHRCILCRTLLLLLFMFSSISRPIGFLDQKCQHPWHPNCHAGHRRCCETNWRGQINSDMLVILSGNTIYQCSFLTPCVCRISSPLGLALDW